MNILELIFVKHRFLVSFLIRLVLSILQFHNDLDYDVFTDAAKYYLEGGSPYDRETFRYSPLIAYIAIPNITIDYRFGKILFSFIDVAVGAACEIVLVVQDKKIKQPYLSSKYRWVSIFYLYNPFAVIIAARGSFDCLVALLVIMTLILIELHQFVLAAFVYGLALHFKIYPVVFILALYFYIIKTTMKVERTDSDRVNFFTRLCGSLIEKLQYIANAFMNVQAIAFVFVSLATFSVLLMYFYLEYGNTFLYEYLLYHVVRKDHRWNNSMYFYMIYLTYQSSVSSIVSIMAFLPQALLIFAASVLFFPDINMCLLVIIKVFVNFNKVSTAQYRIWYMSLIPLILPLHRMIFDRKKRAVKLVVILFVLEIIIWFLSFDLELEGGNKFYELWLMTGLLFFADCLAIKYIMKHYGYNTMEKLKIE